MAYLGESDDYLKDESWVKDGYLPFGRTSEVGVPLFLRDLIEYSKENAEEYDGKENDGEYDGKDNGGEYDGEENDEEYGGDDNDEDDDEGDSDEDDVDEAYHESLAGNRNIPDTSAGPWIIYFPGKVNRDWGMRSWEEAVGHWAINSWEIIKTESQKIIEFWEIGSWEIKEVWKIKEAWEIIESWEIESQKIIESWEIDSGKIEYWKIAEDMKKCVEMIRGGRSDAEKRTAAENLKNHLIRCLDDGNLSDLTAFYRNQRENNPIGYNTKAVAKFLSRMVLRYPKPPKH